jgi:hypothetical protein
MGYPFPGIGIVFNIDDLNSGSYGYRAWQIFMRNVRPTELGGCLLVEGDTALTLDGRANEFCIGVYGLRLDLRTLRERFELLNERGLAAMPRRIMEKTALDVQPLPDRGRVDAFGRLVTDVWMRMDHDLCKGADWGYAPADVPPDLPEDLRRELEGMRQGKI